MSFGFSISDAIAVTQLAWSLVQKTKEACGEHDEFSHQALSLHIVLQRLEQEIRNPVSLLNKDSQGTKKEVSVIITGCEKELKLLDKVLEKYNALSGRNRSGRKLWLRVRFGNGEIADMRDIRAKITYYTAALSLLLNIISLGYTGRVEQQMNNAGVELREIKSAVNFITAQKLASSHEGSVLTTYADDEKAVWKEFRRELIADGFNSDVISRHKLVIKAYVSELAERGLLDEQMGQNGRDQDDSSANQHELTSAENSVSDSEPSLRASSEVQHAGCKLLPDHGRMPARSSPAIEAQASLLDRAGMIDAPPRSRHSRIYETPNSGYSASSTFTKGHADRELDEELDDSPQHDDSLEEDEMTDQISLPGLTERAEVIGQFKTLPTSPSKSVSPVEINTGSQQIPDTEPTVSPERTTYENSLFDLHHEAEGLSTSSTQRAVKDYGGEHLDDATEKKNIMEDLAKPESGREEIVLHLRIEGFYNPLLARVTIYVRPKIWAALDCDIMDLLIKKYQHSHLLNVAASNVRLSMRTLARLLLRGVNKHFIEQEIVSFASTLSNVWWPDIRRTQLGDRLVFCSVLMCSILRKLTDPPYQLSLAERESWWDDPRYDCPKSRTEKGLLKQICYIVAVFAVGLVPVPKQDGKGLGMDLLTEHYSPNELTPGIPSHTIDLSHLMIEILEPLHLTYSPWPPLYSHLLKAAEEIVGRQYYIQS